MDGLTLAEQVWLLPAQGLARLEPLQRACPLLGAKLYAKGGARHPTNMQPLPKDCILLINGPRQGIRARVDRLYGQVPAIKIEGPALRFREMISCLPCYDSLGEIDLKMEVNVFDPAL